MFEGLSEKLSGILDKLTRRGALTEEDVNAALREVRRALLEADVALEVVRSFTDKVRSRAVGAEVLKSVTPGQMVVKIVHDQLVEMLGAEAGTIDLNAVPPVPILMVGLQGSGKTTTTAKIAKRLTERGRRRVLMASLDTRRPAAMEQLAVLGKQVGVDTLPIVAGQSPVQIARRAIEAARLGGFDVVMLDTAGRVTVDEALMAEVAEVKAATESARGAARRRRADRPGRGQHRPRLRRAPRRHRHRADPHGRRRPRRRGAVDARRHRQADQARRHRREGRCAGGVPPAARRQPHPRHGRHRLAGREGGRERSTRRRPSAPPRRCARASSTSTICATSSPRWRRSAAWAACMGMLPGIGKMKAQIEQAGLDDGMIRRQRAIIDSMTPKERHNPDLLKASRKKRIAAGSGTTRRGGQQAPQDAPPDGRHDEDDGRRQRPRHRRRARQHDGPRRRRAACRSRRRRCSPRCRRRWAAACRRMPGLAAACRRCRRDSGGKGPAHAWRAAGRSADRSCPALPGARRLQPGTALRRRGRKNATLDGPGSPLRSPGMTR